MDLDLAAMAKRANPSRSADINLNLIRSTKAQADDLARIYVNIPRLVVSFAQNRLIPAYRIALEQHARDSLSIISPSQVVEKIDMADDVNDVQGEINSLGADLDRLILTLTPELKSWVIRQEKWHRGQWAANVKTATNVDLATMIGPEDAEVTMATVLARNVALIRDLSAEAQGRVGQAIWGGFQARQSARDVAQVINTAVTMSRSRALRIATDQTTKLSAALDTERRQQAGIDTWIWRWSHKVHGRPEHIARDGVTYMDETAPDDMPGDLPYCGCRAQAKLVFGEG